MNNAQAVHVIDGFEDLLDQFGGVALRVTALLDNPVKQLAAVYSGSRACVCLESGARDLRNCSSGGLAAGKQTDN